MKQNTLVILGIGAAALYLISRSRAAGAGSYPGAPYGAGYVPGYGAAGAWGTPYTYGAGGLGTGAGGMNLPPGWQQIANQGGRLISQLFGGAGTGTPGNFIPINYGTGTAASPYGTGPGTTGTA